MDMLIPHPMITTAFQLDGFVIRKNVGVVRGITVRSRNVFGTIGGSLQSLVGGDISMFTELCEKAREQAFALMSKHAAELGANAIIGMRYDANEVMSGVTEVLAYGTGVVVEPLHLSNPSQEGANGRRRSGRVSSSLPKPRACLPRYTRATGTTDDTSPSPGSRSICATSPAAS